MEDIRAQFHFIVYLEHAVERLVERGIRPGIIREAIHSEDAEIIESYLDDPRGPACLILGWWNERRPLHIEVSLGQPPLMIITAYDPSADPKDRWEADFRTRRRMI